METLPIKINELSPIMITLIEKIQLLDSVILTKQQKLQLTKEMIEVVDNFRDFFVKASGNLNEIDEKEKLFNEKVERAFSQFEWDSNVAVQPFEFKKYSESGKNLISAILKLLGTKGCGVLIIETYLKLCIKGVVEMIDNVNHSSSSDDKTNCRLLLEALLLTTNMFKKYWHISFLPNQKSAIMLCLHQTCKILPILLKMIEAENKDLKKFALNNLKNCLNKILEEIHSEGNLQSGECGQEFITLMNFCLYKLNEVSNSTSDFSNFIQKSNETAVALKPVIDELLCYVMSVAQVIKCENDYAAILAGSKKVLKEFSDLNTEISEEVGCAIKLNASSLGEALCTLEHQVNTAVLHLVLEVFSGVNSPLKNIVNRCRTNITKDNKALEDLNALISDFDLEMDRIMQIGLFAISCTSNRNRILKIQSCLASLESLETELIPSLTALYLDCTPQIKVNFQYLIDFWLSGITELKTLIDSILDPAGFCGVVCNQIKALVLDFKEDVCLNKAQFILKQAIRYSRKLIKTLKTSMEDENEICEATEDHLKNFQLAVQECEAVLNLLDKENNDQNLNRAVKRCDLLMSTLKKLSFHLFQLASNEKLESDILEKSDDTPVPNMQIPVKNYYKLCGSIEIRSTPSDLEILTPYINKGIMRSKRRNILHKNKLQSVKKHEKSFEETILQGHFWDKTPVSHKRSRCCKPLNLNLELGNTIDFEITTILDNVSQISNELSKTEPYDSKKQDGESRKEAIKKGKDVACGMEKDTDYFKRVFTSSGCCAKLDSEESEKLKKETEDSEDAKNFIGDKLRSQFLQSLDDLSKNNSLVLSTESDVDNDLATPDRLNDLKVVEQRIDFLKQQVPGVLP